MSKYANTPQVKNEQLILSEEIHAGDNPLDLIRIASRITESEKTGELDKTPERDTEKIDENVPPNSLAPRTPTIPPTLSPQPEGPPSPWPQP